MSRDSISHTFKVAFILCVVCSVLVSAAAVGLRAQQRENKERERKSNILSAAGLAEEAQRDGVDETYRRRVVEKIVELKTGEFVTDITPEEFDQRAASRDPELSASVPDEADVARVRRRELYSFVYLIQGDQGQTDQIVLPIRGYGLWSTLWGFISLDARSISEGPDAIAVRGLTYYEHGETPGLGGEVDNPIWKEKWRTGKEIYDNEWNVRLRVAKGSVDADDPQAEYKVDGLSGATITANGVTNMLQYWFGDHGFLPLLKNASQRPEMLTDEGGDTNGKI